jgi:hypothetical protein
MKSKIYLLLIPAIVILFAVIGFGAQNSKTERGEKCCPPKKCETPEVKKGQCCEKPKEKKETCCEKPCNSCDKIPEPSPAPCNCAFNCPARVVPQCNWNVNVFGSFLYWQQRERGLELGEKFENTSNTTNDSSVNMDFDYHPAFKVGLGFNSNTDDWTTSFEYTRFKSTSQKTTRVDFVADETYLQEAWVSNDLYQMVYDQLGFTSTSNVVKSIEAKWRLDLNLIDFTAGRPYWLGTKIYLQPLVGLRGGWINQKYTTHNVAPLLIGASDRADFDIYYTGKSKSWLIGPRIGIGSNWLLGCSGFRFFGNASASLFYQDIKTKINNEAPVQGVLTTAQKYNFNHKMAVVTPSFDSILGFGWGSYFNNNKWHFDFTAGYEFQYFYNQNAIRIEPINFSDAPSLMLHGLNLTAKFDF